MNNPHAGAQIKAARLSKQWRPAVLARRTGLSPSRLSRLESEELYPTLQDWSLLAEHLVLGPYPERARLDLPAVRRRWFPELPSRPDAERPFGTRLFAARASFGTLAERYLAVIKARPDRRLCFKFLNEARLESGHEAMFWMALLAGGGNPGRHSPHRAGFLKFPIVDPDSKELLAEPRTPCLDLKFERFEALLFPQISLDTRSWIYRLDALACLWSPRARIWADIEIDGQGHASYLPSDYDLTRQRLIGLPTERISTAQLQSPKLIAGLESRLFSLFGLPEAN